MRPLIMLARVVLPAPFGPMTARISPLGRLRSDVFDGLDAAEVPAERLGPKQDHGRAPLHAWRNVPMIPLGKAMISTTRMMPTAIM